MARPAEAPLLAARVFPRAAVAAGVVLFAFGWAYPHFIETRAWITYLIAAPLGLLPCPTLAAVIGMSMALGRLESTAWSVTLGLAGLAYGLIGIFNLGVLLDVGLAVGALALLLDELRHRMSESAQADASTRVA